MLPSSHGDCDPLAGSTSAPQRPSIENSPHVNPSCPPVVSNLDTTAPCDVVALRVTTTKPYCMNPMLVQEMSIGVGSWCIQGLSLEVVASLRSSCRWERPALVQLSELSEPLSELSELSDDVRASSHRIYYRTLSERVLSDYRRRHYRTIGAIGVLSDAIGVYYRNYRTGAPLQV